MAFPGTGRSPRDLKIKETNTRATFKKQPTPLHDYLNFKTMTNNEVLLNLQNSDNFSTSELIGGLVELGNRDRHHRFNWAMHPTTAKCVEDLMQQVGSLGHKHTLQAAVILQKLYIIDQGHWQKIAKNALRMLHKYKAH